MRCEICNVLLTNDQVYSRNDDEELCWSCLQAILDDLELEEDPDVNYLPVDTYMKQHGRRE